MYCMCLYYNPAPAFLDLMFLLKIDFKSLNSLQIVCEKQCFEYFFYIVLNTQHTTWHITDMIVGLTISG